MLAALAYYVALAIQHGVSFLPLGIGADISGAIEGALVSPLKKIMDGASADIAKGLNALANSLAVLVGVPLLLGLGVKAALTYLWKQALPAFVHAVVDPVFAVARQALAKVEAVPADIARAFGRAESFATSEAERAIRAAETLATHAALNAEHAAERYADEAVSALRGAEEAALSSVLSIAHAAETDASRALDHATAAAEAIAVPIGKELTALEQYIQSLDLAQLVTSVPALALLVTTIAAESGLGNAECRSKVKGICGTDPAAWGRLLGLAAFLTLAFDFKDFVKGAELVAEGIGTLVADLEKPFNLQLPPLPLAA